MINKQYLCCIWYHIKLIFDVLIHNLVLMTQMKANRTERTFLLHFNTFCFLVIIVFEIKNNGQAIVNDSCLTI